MKYLHRRLAVLAAGLAMVIVFAVASACAKPVTAQAEGATTVVVSVLPQAWFVERIAGGRFSPVVLVGAGQSPHAYEPTPRQMAELSAAPIWLTIGVEFENALKPKVAALYPGLAIVDTTSGVVFRNLERHNHETATGEASVEEESGVDPHVWLGRQASKVMAANIRDALSRYDPDGSREYGANYDALVREIDAVFEGLAADLKPLEGESVFVYHPSFGYFLDEFNIRQEAVETGGKEPTQKDLAAIVEEARADGSRVMFVQPQFPASAARSVAAATGGVVVEIDALAPDWLDNIKRIGQALAAGAGSGTP